jgi:hypothetical protein
VPPLLLNIVRGLPLPVKRVPAGIEKSPVSKKVPSGMVTYPSVRAPASWVRSFSLMSIPTISGEVVVFELHVKAHQQQNSRMIVSPLFTDSVFFDELLNNVMAKEENKSHGK